MKMNRYIKAMEIGLANEIEGISYLELLEEMQKDLGYNFNGLAEITFLSWFNKNFESFGSYDYLGSLGSKDAIYIDGQRLYFLQKSLSNNLEKITDSKEIKHYEFFISFINRKFFLKGNAAKQYLDYLELKHARKQARQTSYFSIGSIIIAVIAIGIGIYQVNDSPQPPFEVKIIEDNTKVKELQTQVDRLKEELHKVKVQESGSE